MKLRFCWIFISFILSVAVSFPTPATALEPLADNELRTITGAEGLSVQADEVVEDLELNLGSLDNFLRESESTELVSLGLSESRKTNPEPQFNLKGDMSGISTRYLENSPGSASYTRSVDAAGPYFIDMTVTPARPVQTRTQSDISLALPELDGSIGGDFVINSPGRVNSAGQISMGGLKTPGRVEINTSP